MTERLGQIVELYVVTVIKASHVTKRREPVHVDVNLDTKASIATKVR